MAATWDRIARFPSSIGSANTFVPKRSLAIAALLLGAAISSVPAAAQDDLSLSAAPSDQLCKVFAVEGSRDGVEQLLASCRGHGLMLGETSGYEVVINEALQATLVDMRLDGERRILLITIQEDGEPLVEDLGGQIALAAGRGPMSALDGLEIDLSRYLTDSEIAVRPTGGAAGEKIGEVRIGEQIALERMRRQGAALQD